MSPVYAAPSGTFGGPIPLPGDLFGSCESSVNGQVSFQAGGFTVVVHLPYIPPLGCLAYNSPCPNNNSCPISTIAVPSLPDFSCPGIAWYDPLSWGSIISCISSYLASTFFVWLPSFIIDTVADFFIQGFDEIYSIVSYATTYLINAVISVTNMVIIAFDAIPLGLGQIVIGFVTAIPEPYSAFLDPFVWLIVVVVMVGMLIAALFVVRFIVKGAEKGASVAEIAA